MKLSKGQLRKLINEEVEKIEQINEFAGKQVFKAGIKNILKSTGLAIPGLDLWLGSIIAGVDLINIKLATDRMIDELPIVGNSIMYKLAATEDEWQEVLVQVQLLPPEKRELFKALFDELLGSLKDFVLTLIQSYDSLAAAPVAAGAGAASVGAGAVAVEVGTNLTTGLASLIAGVMPIERFLFSAGTKIAKASEWILAYVRDISPDKIINMEIQGGQIMMYFTNEPVKTFIRLGELYDALHNPDETALTALKDVDTSDVLSLVGNTVVDTIPLSESRFRKLAGIK